MKSMTMRRLGTALTAAAMALSTMAFVAGPAAADIGSGCNQGQLPNFADDANLTVTITDDGLGTATYQLGTTNENPVGGIPGLIEYCVFGTPIPDSATTDASIAVLGWSDPAQVNVFSWQRPNGDSTNLPFDGTTYNMGTATWNSGTVPVQTVLLHINDPDVCGASLTCYVHPTGGTCDAGCGGGEGAALTIDKTASGAYSTSYTWDISKSACLHGVTPCKQSVEQVGGSVTFDYTVTVTRSAGVDGQETVSGTITVGNSNIDGVDGVTVTDQLSDGTNCDVTDAAGVTVPSGGDTYSYTCDPTTVAPLTNTATVSWPTQTLPDDGLLPGSSGLDSLPVTVDPVTQSFVDDCTHVTDPNAPSTVLPADTCATHTYNYSKTFTVGTGCTDYKNTATETTDDTSTSKTADATVTVCGPARTGALTIGFWKTTNGQNLIKTYCGTGTSGLVYYLAHLGAGSGPFSNATSSTTCSALATYVYNILNGANAKNMNSMLKAQMLGTALDVWFSGPGWSSTTVNKIKPPSGFLSHNSLGTFNMDTTAICPMVDNLNTGTATCKNNTPSTDAVAAGAVPTSPMSIQSILDFASTTPSPFNGSTSNSIWYGGNSTKEEILKNIFDQFNNQDAFGSF